MRRTARGRMVPHSRSTDPRIGRVSLKAAVLYDRMWINGDDQGRLPGDPDELKYSTCPNLPDISQQDIPALLGELESQKLILSYNSTMASAIQLLDWWHEQKLQWAYPSDFSAPDGWTDHLRYHPTPTEIVTENWPPELLPSKLPSPLASTLPSNSAQQKKEPKKNTENEEEDGRGRGRGRLPSTLGSNLASPSPSDLSTNGNDISIRLQECFKWDWGSVEAKDPGNVIAREPTPKDLAQLRDLAEELVAGGGCPLSYIREAFREAAGQGKHKEHISYVRAILMDWLGRERDHGGKK